MTARSSATGVVALIASLALSALGLFAIGAGITLTTGTPLLKAGGRQVLFGMAAAAITFGLGHLVGGALGERARELLARRRIRIWVVQRAIPVEEWQEHRRHRRRA